jgi:hypothetical protein
MCNTLANIFLGPAMILGPGQRYVSQRGHVSMYSSTPANESSPLLFAFGSSHGVLTIDKTRLDLKWEKPVIMQDIWALEFQRDKNDVLLSGGRRGILYCNDLKDPSTLTDGSTLIKHPSSITHIRQLDSHRILVAGLENSLCQYDLRYLKLDPDASTSVRPYKSSDRGAAAGSSPRPGRSCTRSILQYPDYYNTATREIGFDVDLEAGVVAAAQETNEFQPPVRLFSLWSGHTLRSPALEHHYKQSHNSNREHIRCLKLSRDIDYRMKSLYIAQGSSIQRFSWAGEEDDRPKSHSYHRTLETLATLTTDDRARTGTLSAPGS